MTYSTTQVITACKASRLRSRVTALSRPSQTRTPIISNGPCPSPHRHHAPTSGRTLADSFSLRAGMRPCQTLARRSATGPKTIQNSKLTAPITSTGTPPLRWIAVRYDPMTSSSTVPLEPIAANASILPGAPKGAVEVRGPVNAFIESDCPCAPALFSAKRIGPPRPRGAALTQPSC